MPRKLNPGTLTTGHGKAAPDEIALRPELTGAGLAGPGPNIGEIQQTIPSLPGQLAVQSVIAHIDDPKQAHTASAIEHDGHPDILWSTNVEGALDELIGTVLKRPPMLGEWSPDTTFSGITDWGSLKLRDGGLENYAALTFTDATVQNDANVYPYLLSETGPPRDTEFAVPMTDPRTDHQFNWGMDSLGEPGMGYGRAHMGAYTRDGGGAAVPPLPIFRSGRIFPRPAAFDATTGRNERAPVTVSGNIFPADRGVLALIHFVVPRGASVAASFLAQPLVSDETAHLSTQGRVVAAILLGNGILGDKCHGVDPCADAHLCDGDPGGIFGPGVDASGNYDPFQFPGRASGQYDLLELHLGVNSAAQALKVPWNDLDGDTVAGAQRTPTAVIPAPGQVRLGTDPDAAPLLPVVPNGIPILGGTAACFTAVIGAQPGSLTLPILGDAVIRSSNFFRYRLPVLKDYSPATGLKWTPRGEVPTTTFETSRFFDVATPSSATYEDGTPVVGGLLRSAGVYDDFDEDYWVWQIARYRQTFLMPSIAANNVRDEAGTYMLVHFKRETDFESFVRDAVFPWDTPVPYEVYGASIVDAPEDIDNLANDWPAATVPVAPNGPAPAYGYAANPWHNIRNRIFMDPNGVNLPGVTSDTLTWTSASAPGGGTEEVVWVSGIAYFTPRDITTGAPSVRITECDITLAAGFWSSYRTDYADLETWPTIGPAVVASQNPAMVATAPWGYGPDGGLASSLTVPVNPNPAIGFIPATTYQDQFRLEVPFTHLGGNVGGAFTDANAPLDADPLVLALPSPIELLGDNLDPSFSSNAVVRVHFRRPLNHIAANSTNLPHTAADGHGYLLTHTDAGTVLLHTTRWDAANRVGDYGNFLVGGAGAIEFNTPLKDYTERFLDEGHRYVADAPAGINGTGPYTAATIAALDGPGMGGWAGGPVETPVRVSLANAPWSGSSWLLQGHHLLDLSGATLSHDALQVAGLPDRNPQIKDVNTVPFPSAGVLIYPRTNYAVGHFPVTVTHITAVQFDYSGAVGQRTYIRCFDAAFSNHATPVAVAGKSDLLVRLDGITLADILYAAPGPGGLNASRIAVALKVPGLTTWMDAGRQDGAGPSKQDNLLDGAGCLVLGNETYTFTDPVTGYKGCYLKINVGPVAGLFINPALWSSYTAGSPLGEAPVLVKVSMDQGALSYNLEHRATGVGTFEGGPAKPGGESDQVRGLFTMRLVHPADTLIASD